MKCLVLLLFSHRIACRCLICSHVELAELAVTFEFFTIWKFDRSVKSDRKCNLYKLSHFKFYRLRLFKITDPC